MSIEMRNVVKTYEMNSVGVKALRGVSFDIASNEFLAIMGPSGSGKSTLMNIIGCLDVPTSGQYILDGHDVSTLSDDRLAEIRNANIGFVFQTFNLIPRVDVYHNVELPLVYSGLRPAKRRELTLAAIESVGLSDRIRHRPNELSGGQRQRVAIARALVNEPTFILADEPTGNLDTTTGSEIMAVFDDLHRDGHTVILVTHEEDIARHAHRIIRLRDGLIEVDTAQREAA